MNIAFIGVGYFQKNNFSDKKFFQKLADELSKDNNIIFISFNDLDNNIFYKSSFNKLILIYSIKRSIHFFGYRRFFKNINDVICYHHRHNRFAEVLEKTITFIFNYKKIKNILKNHQIEVVHFMDNNAIVMHFFKKFFKKIIVSFSAAIFEPRGILYKRFLRFSLSKLDLIFTYTNEYKKILVDLGLNKKKIKKINWGISFKDYKYEKNDSNFLLDKNEYNFLWTGFIQQIQEKDFYKTIEIAKKITAKHKNINFIFAFKIQTFKNKYKKEEEIGRRILVLKKVNNFLKLLANCDLLVSPIYNLSSTIAPPITWIEAFLFKVPVLTTCLRGVNEVITNNKNGFIVNGYNEIPSKIDEILKNKKIEKIKIRQREYDLINNYNIINIRKKYFNIWGRQIE